MDVLLNWLVQGSVLAALAAAGLRAIPRSRTQARHGFVWTAYLALFMLPTVSPLLALVRGAAPTGATQASAAALVTVPPVWWTSATLAAGLW
ncbi:hypothetical protein CG434_23835, partial [Pantoea ananatis]|uniref:hypothetical protein n=1 Tax=Pantoea ananas TaxID=553 RepID=UPI000D4EA573